jgi:hypothetical protein
LEAPKATQAKKKNMQTKTCRELGNVEGGAMFLSL